MKDPECGDDDDGSDSKSIELYSAEIITIKANDLISILKTHFLSLL